MPLSHITEASLRLPESNLQNITTNNHYHLLSELKSIFEMILKQASWQEWTRSFSTWATRPAMTWCPSTFIPTTWGHTGSIYLSPFGARRFGYSSPSSCTGTRSSLLSEWFYTGSHTSLIASEHKWMPPHPEQVYDIHAESWDDLNIENTNEQNDYYDWHSDGIWFWL